MSIYVPIPKMAGALRSCGSVRIKESCISFLIVAPSELCEKINSTLHRAAVENNTQIVVHQCEFIAEVVRQKPDLAVDFIVFAIEGEISHRITEVETNISLIDEHFIISGCTCLLYCHGVSSNPGVNYWKAKQIADKYCLRRFLSVNILDPNNCKLLGKRLLNLSEGILSFKSNLPMIDTPITFA